MNKNILKTAIQLSVVGLMLISAMHMNIGKVEAQAESADETPQVISPQNVQDLKLLRWIGEGAYTGTIAQQTDGNLIAAATTAGVKLLDRESGEQIGFIPIGLEPTALSISPDGNTLAVVVNYPDGSLGGFMGLPGFNPQIQFYSLPAGEKQGEAIDELGECGESNILAIAYSPEGSELVFERKHSAQNDGRRFCVLSVAERKIVRTKDVSDSAQMVISPQGDFVAVIAANSQAKSSTVSIYSTEDFHLVTEFEINQTVFPYNFSFSQGGQYLGLNSYEEDQNSTVYSFQVWDLEDGELVFSEEPSEDMVQSFDVDSNRSALIVGTQFGYVKIYSLNTGKMEKQLGPFTWTNYSQTGNPGGVTAAETPASIKSVIVSRSGESLTVSDYMTTYGQSSHIRIFDMPDGGAGADFVSTSMGSESLQIAFSPDSSQIALAGSLDGRVDVFNAQNGELALTLSGHTQVVNQVIFSPDGNVIATGSNDNTVRLWNAQTGALLRVLEGHQGRVNRLVFSPDSTWLLSGADDNSLRRWNVSDGELLETLELGNENWRVEFLDILNDNVSVVYRIIKYPSPYIGFITKQMIWNTQSGESQNIGGSDISISGLSADKDLFMGFSSGKMVGTLQEDGSMKTITTFRSPYGNGALTKPAISPDNQLVIAGNGFGLHAWELNGSSLNFLGLIAVSEPVPSYGDEYLFSPDRKYLAYTAGGVAYLMGVIGK